jgi:PPM family protein phosphatase
MKNLLRKILAPGGDENDQAYGMTHPGLRRENNEDAFALLFDRSIYIVADGMGGHNAGEVAADRAIRGLDAYFGVELVAALRQDESKIQEQMERAFVETSRSIHEMSKTDESLSGMGCTLIMALVRGGNLHTCHVGDVRCYVCGPTGMAQQGNDHSQVWELVRGGHLTPEQARKHRMKNVLSQAIGQGPPVSPEYHIRGLQQGEKVLLCSDGLWDMLTDEEIGSILIKHPRPRDACARLIERANAAGGRDNVTVIIIPAPVAESGTAEIEAQE